MRQDTLASSSNSALPTICRYNIRVKCMGAHRRSRKTVAHMQPRVPGRIQGPQARAHAHTRRMRLLLCDAVLQLRQQDVPWSSHCVAIQHTVAHCIIQQPCQLALHHARALWRHKGQSLRARGSMTRLRCRACHSCWHNARVNALTASPGSVCACECQHAGWSTAMQAQRPLLEHQSKRLTQVCAAPCTLAGPRSLELLLRTG